MGFLFLINNSKINLSCTILESKYNPLKVKYVSKATYHNCFQGIVSNQKNQFILDIRRDKRRMLLNNLWREEEFTQVFYF